MSGLLNHLISVANETGESLVDVISDESTVTIHGHAAEVFYNETRSCGVWEAFVRGVGTVTGQSRSEAIEAMERRLSQPTKIRLPGGVRRWAEQFVREGESPRAAVYHAIQRAFESGDISEATADRLESQIETAVASL